MNIEEMSEIKLTFAPRKDRAHHVFNLQKNVLLAKAIERVLATGVEEYVENNCILYHLKPRFPLIDSAMEDPKNASLLRVSIQVFTQRFSLGVRS